MVRYSIVVPVYNEMDSLPELDRRISAVMDKFGDYEIIYVDDGSTDSSGVILDKIAKKGKRKVLRMRVNRGQSAALARGIRSASGDIVVTIDADLQNPPEDIEKLITELENGNWDCVSGWRKERNDPLFSKKIPSYLSNWLARNLMNVDIHDFGCTLKAYRRSALSDIQFWDGAHRYIPAMIALRRGKVTEVPVGHVERKAGKSKYGARRLILGLLDLLYIRFVYKPSISPFRTAIYSIGTTVLIGISFYAASSMAGTSYLRTGMAVAAIPFFMLAFVLSGLWWLLSIRYRDISRETSG